MRGALSTVARIARPALVLAILLSATAGADTLRPGQIRALDSLLEEHRDKGGFPGLVVWIDRGGENVYASARGLADLENDVAATVDSVFAIGSITKSFTALATLQLVEKGRLGLTDTVGSILDDYRGPGRDATVAQLLAHTSGIPNFLNEIPAVPDSFARERHTRQRMRSYFENEPLLFAPDTRWSYSNSGYYLLGLIVEKTSGEDFYGFIDKHILVPLDLHNTYSGDGAQIVPLRARGYETRDGRVVNAQPWHHLVPFSAGSLLSTASDVARYRRAVFQSDTISPGLRKLLLRTTELKDGTRLHYALGGLVSSIFHGHRKYSHSGYIYGFSAAHAHYPEIDLTVVVLTNGASAASTPTAIERKISRTVLDIPQPEIRDVAPDRRVLQRLVGDYDVGPVLFGPRRYGFVAHERRLALKPGGVAADAPELRLLAQGQGRFVLAENDEWSLHFDVAGDGAVSFEMTVRDAIVRGRKVD